MTAAGPADTVTPRPGSTGGLTVPGVVLVLLLVTGAGAAGDLVLARDLHWGISVAYVVAAVLVASRVRRRDLLAAVIAAPIAFAAVVVVAVFATGSGGGVTRTGMNVATELALLAPGLWIGTVLAALVALVRRRRR